MLLRTAAVHLVPVGTDEHPLLEERSVGAAITELVAPFCTHVVDLRHKVYQVLGENPTK